MLLHFNSLLVINTLAALVALLVFRSLRSWYRLRHIPGPWINAWSDIFRARWVWSNHAHDHHIAAHRRYGPIVRFGPGMVSVSDPAEISSIYRVGDPLKKSDFYRVLSFFVGGRPVPGLFATQDEDVHRMLRRPIAGMYSMSNIVKYEPFVDSTITCLLAQLDARYEAPATVCPLDQWLEMFAFDVIGELTFSRRLGFLEQGRDIEGIMAKAWHYFSVQAPKTQMVWLDRVWAKNPMVQSLRARFTTAPPNAIVAFANARWAERTQAAAPDSRDAHTTDFLSRFIDTQAKQPHLPRWAVSAWATSNISAGSDTTAILLRTIFHRLLAHPASLAALRAELAPFPAGAILSWKQAQELPYLDACIKEAGRLHPPFALPYERVVGPGGLVACGQYLPEGTIVGMPAWAVHRTEAVFGRDVDAWRPERWLEADEAARKRMEASLLTFGAGHRSCIGKNLSMLETYKLVPTLVHAYDWAFAEPGCPTWKVENRWFANQHGLDTRLTRRKT